MIKSNFIYNEFQDALNNRIDIHKKFSNFNLHNWIKENLKILPNQKILDMGCGNGNFIKFFLEITKQNIEITGVDKNIDLINEAKNKIKDINVKFINEDFDNLDIKNSKFDWIFFIYSVYYSVNSQKLVEKIKSYLDLNSNIVMIGPGQNNALELDDLNKSVTGLRPKKEYRERQTRLENEFYKILLQNFTESKVSLEIINNELRFPNSEEYAKYYWSTLLWRDSLERIQDYNIESLKEISLNKINKLKEFVIKKQVCVLKAQK